MGRTLSRGIMTRSQAFWVWTGAANNNQTGSNDRGSYWARHRAGTRLTNVCTPPDGWRARRAWVVSPVDHTGMRLGPLHKKSKTGDQTGEAFPGVDLSSPITTIEL